MAPKKPISSTELTRIDETLTYIKNAVAKKANKESLNTELNYQNDKMVGLMKDIEKLEKQINTLPAHSCAQISRIDDLKDDIIKNEKDIKRLYIWLSGVGFSLLLFFLTLGVAALRLVDRAEFTIEQNTKQLNKLDQKLENNEERNEKIIRDAVIDAILDPANR